MKKKLKLFLSISSLCFALAMLCFGVYSAQTVNYSLNGNVTYTVQDAFVEVQTKLYKSTTLLTSSQLGQKVNDVAGMDFASTPEGLTLVDTSEVYSSTSGVQGTYEKPNLKFSTKAGEECYAYFFVINIKNLSSDVNVWAKMEDDFTNPANTVQINNERQPTIDQTGKNMVIGLTVEDFTQNIPTTNNAFRYNIKIGVGDLPIEQLNSGNVTYTVQEALVEVQTKLYKSTTFLTSSQLGLKVNDVAEMDFATAPEGLILVDTSEVYSSTSDVPGIYENVNLNFSTQAGSECYAYFFVVNIKKLSPDVNVWAVMEDELTNPANTVQINNGLQQNISQAGNNMVIGIGIEDLNQNISTENNTFSYGIKIGVGELATQDFNLAKLTFNNGTVAANRSNMNGVVVIPDKNPTTGEAITTIKGYYRPSSSPTNSNFSNTNFTTIAMADNIQSIGDFVTFSCNKYLTKVILSKNLTSIGGQAFWNCTALTTIEIPNGVTSIGSGVFEGCTALATIEIPNSITSINSFTFSGCINLTSITIPNSVTSLPGQGAFSGCTKLINTDDENNLKYIQTTDNNYFALYGTVIDQSTYTINPNCKFILSYAFDSCTSLTSIEIPNSVNQIGEYAFSGCTGLNRVTIPSSVTSIGNSAFNGCTSLTSIEIPNSVNQIGGYAFSGCTGLTTIEIPSSVTSIEDRSFENCKSLSSITIPDSVTSIGDYAFDRCTGLTSITIPDSVTSIGNYAFNDCTGINLIEIPSSVISMGYCAFWNWTEEQTIKVPFKRGELLSGWAGNWTANCNAKIEYLAA